MFDRMCNPLYTMHPRIDSPSILNKEDEPPLNRFGLFPPQYAPSCLDVSFASLSTKLAVYQLAKVRRRDGYVRHTEVSAKGNVIKSMKHYGDNGNNDDT